MSEVSFVGAGINPQRLGTGESLVDRVVTEGTPYILYSYPYMQKASGSVRRVVENVKKLGAKLVIDSGGFELAEGTATGIDPVEVIKLQNAIAHFGFILDFPPDHEPFDKCLQMTADHVKAAAMVKKTFQYYLVVHGRDFEQMNTWYNTLKDLDKFDGISVSGIEFAELLRGFIFAWFTPGWPRWHFLGTSSITQVSLIHYFSKKMEQAGRKEVERYTFDSTTPTQFGRVCRIFHPCAPLEVVDPRRLPSEYLRWIKSDFDGSASSCILHNVKSTVNYSTHLSMIKDPEAVAEFVEVLLSGKKLGERWNLGKRIIDAVFERGSIEALKLIPPELNRVEGLRKQASILTL